MIRFYFDYISHNAYLAWTQIQALAKRHGREVEPVAVLFAGQLKHYGQRGPAEMPPKRDWMLKNVLRKALAHGIPIAPPASHPFNPLLPLRLSCVMLPAQQHIRLIDAIYRATWAEGRAVQQPEVLREILGGLGLDADALLAAAQSAEIKQKLVAQTEQALARGVFGVPTMQVGAELFWGFDDLPWLERHLRGDDPLARVDLAPWAQVRPSAQRKESQASEPS